MDPDSIKRLGEIWAAQEKYHEPWTTGVVDLSGSETLLFFKQASGSSHHLQVGSITDKDMDALIGACDPATFGRGPANVLDETYRKAWKLDEDSFAWRFYPDSGKFVSRLAQGFCPWDDIGKGLRVEPYKLNVYGQGGFFKAHKDTPHAENMFGSLVFTLPTQHEGGNLILRHRTRELNFDAASLLQSATPTSVAYVAFYSDIEHEVLEVTSGNRVTITFNLYFDPFRSTPVLPKEPLKVPKNPFTIALRDLFRDAAFIRNHSYLGFGLEHEYPERLGAYNRWNLEERLKGPDALLYRILQETGLKPSLKYLYERSNNGCGCDFWLMLSEVVDGRREDSSYFSTDTELPYLLTEDDSACIVWKSGKSEESMNDGYESDSYDSSTWVNSYFKDIKRCRRRTIDVSWVTQPSGNLCGETRYTELGNEAAEEICYYKVCVVVDVKGVPCPRRD